MTASHAANAASRRSRLTMGGQTVASCGLRQSQSAQRSEHTTMQTRVAIGIRLRPAAAETRTLAPASCATVETSVDNIRARSQYGTTDQSKR